MTSNPLHDQRRRQVARALVRVVAEEGIAAASYRKVAQAAGVSPGLVQRYFMSKRDLMRFAFDYLYAQTEERLRVLPRSRTARDWLIAGLTVLLPLDEERRRESAVWLSFLVETRHDPDLHRAHVEATVVLRSLVAHLLDQAKATGECDPAVDSAASAARLIATVDGITLHMATAPELCDEDWGRRALTVAVDQILSGPGEGPSHEP